MTGSGGEGPRVVACLPAWKAAGFIQATLDSLAAQTYPNLRILISDDASPDDTAAICQGYAAADPRFSVIRQPRNLGWTGNVNALLAQAEGDYFLFAFHDDLLLPRYVETLTAALEARPAAIVAYSDVEATHPDGRTEINVYAEMDGAVDPAARVKRVLWQSGHWWLPHRGLFRARAARQIGGLKRHMAGEAYADWAWLTHMAALGEFVRVPEVLCRKIYRKEGLSRKWQRGLWPFLAAALSCAREIRATDHLLPSQKLRLQATLASVALRECRRAF